MWKLGVSHTCACDFKYQIFWYLNNKHFDSLSNSIFLFCLYCSFFYAFILNGTKHDFILLHLFSLFNILRMISISLKRTVILMAMELFWMHGISMTRKIGKWKRSFAKQISSTEAKTIFWHNCGLFTNETKIR